MSYIPFTLPHKSAFVLFSRSVYDFTDYVNTHPSSPSNITGFVDDGVLVYPDIHPMNYWEDLKYSKNIIYVTRYGDREIVDQFADTLGLDQDPDVLVSIAQNTGKIMVKNKIKTSRGSGVLVCGSPNEVASDPLEDDYFDVLHQDADCVGCLDAYGDYFAQKQSVWTMTILGAEDQLCQKVSQVCLNFFVLSPRQARFSPLNIDYLYLLH